MELYRGEFPVGSDVVVRYAESGQVEVVVRTKRPDPVWLASYRGIADARIKVAEPELESSLLDLVAQDPGRGPSHYVRLPLGQGGLGGSQERKERILRRLIEEGKLVEQPVPNPTGRRVVGVYPAGACPAGS